MPRDFILGTAGHIDHGKTSLVKALTGIDCDRLPEEKARGITIDIGFAHLELGEFRLGIVDVPGHERFIKNMLAGATGIDLCMLVVAADDSVMPQTREHLGILQLLGQRNGVIALTKVDLVDATTREVVELEIRDLVKGSFLENAPIISTSAHTGRGLPELKGALQQICQQIAEKPADEWFRLAIDRTFVVQGHGTVVTGSVTSGHLKVGEEVEWLPRGERVRVRSMQNHDQPVEEVHRGMRAALNLAGIKHEDVTRGQELAHLGYLKPSRVLTVRLHVLREHARPVRHRASVRLHIGTAELMGTLSLLDCDEITPGGWGLSQIFIEEPAMAVWGQPFVIRDPSATHTLGGGQVLQPVAEKIRRRHVESLDRVEKLWTGQAEERARLVVWFSGFRSIAPADLVREAAVAPSQAQLFLDRFVQDGSLIQIPLGTHRQLMLHRDRVEELTSRLLDVLTKLHEQFPLMSSHDRQKVQSELNYLGDESLVQALVERLIAQRIITGDNRRIALATHKPKLSTAQRKLKEKIIEGYQAASFQPPEAGSFANQAGGNASSLKDLFEVCTAEGHLIQLAEGLYLHAEHEATLRRRVLEHLASGKGLTVAEIRDLLGTTRKFAVPICEYLDRVGVTVREGDVRYLAPTRSVASTQTATV